MSWHWCGRCGDPALALIVQNELRLGFLFGFMVIFRSKRGDRLKIMVCDLPLNFHPVASRAFACYTNSHWA